MLRPLSASVCAVRPSPSADLVLADRPIAGLLSWKDHGAVIDALVRAGDPPPATAVVAHARGVREYIPEEDGEGFWDFFRLSEYCSISITEATYRKDHWISVEGGRFFKIRVLLSGRLLDRNGRLLAEGPQGQLHVCTGERGGGYSIAGGLATTLVVVHCAPEVLTSRMGLALSEIPSPLRALADSDFGAGTSRSMDITPELYRAARWIHASRYSVLAGVRASYLEALSLQIVCQVVTDLAFEASALGESSGVPVRDRRRLLEAHDLLSRRYANPPTIPQLARLVGINQTKLKARFRQLFNLTIYEYVLARRMEVAAQLLIERELSVGEIAYRVGYEYPANFSAAFKRYYGRLPRDWKLGERSLHDGLARGRATDS